jgi:hypothetical protein
MTLEFIPMWDIDLHWKEIAPHLAKAVAKQSGLSMESLYKDCKSGKYHLWKVPGRAALATQVQTFPCERVFMIVLAGGEGMDDWFQQADEVLTRCARSFDCNAMDIVGRRGWSRILPAYQVEAVVMRKKL